MKTIYIIRHAKSSWANFDQSDFERPLNEKGNNDAPEMAKRLLNKKITIDVFISSPALRAKQTCEHFCQMYKVPLKNIVFNETLYHAPEQVIKNAVSTIDDKFDSAAMFIHNPGITDYVNTLTKKVQIDDMPTCAIFAVEADVQQWKDFSKAEKTFLFFDYPKNK